MEKKTIKNQLAKNMLNCFTKAYKDQLLVDIYIFFLKVHYLKTFNKLFPNGEKFFQENFFFLRKANKSFDFGIFF